MSGGAGLPIHDTASPLTADQFDKLMQACGPFLPAPKFAVAVSGGPDSIALTNLLHAWLATKGGTLHAITIDHQLRDESSAEALQVGQWCAEKSITHQTIVWEKARNPTSAVHQQARKIRYEFLCRACAQRGIDTLFLGQHADDQAETVLMRFIKGSGIDGLAAMPSTRTLDGICIARPLLPVTKQRLVDTCHANGWTFFRDPSNDSPAYLRGRLRQLATPLAQEGLTTTHLFEMARSAGMARAALEATTNEWLQQHAITHPLGNIQFDRNAWQALNDEIQRRTIIRALLCMSGEDYAPKNASLDILIQSLRDNQMTHQTLSGSHIIAQFGLIKFYRELAAVPPHIPAQQEMRWDNRFKIIVDASLLHKNAVIAPLGDISREQLHKMGHSLVADCHAQHRATLPALVVDNQLHSVPDFCSDETAFKTSQALVKTIFLPKSMLCISPFVVCPVLLN